MTLTIALAVRVAMALLAAVALIAHGGFTGTQWRDSSWSLRAGRIGLSGVVLYVLVGQLKGYRLHIPVDGYTWLGLIALAVSAVGLVWEFVRRIRRREG